MQNELNIEVNIVKGKNKYLAKSSSFPSCKGEGKDVKAALNSLGEHITNFISQQVKTSFRNLFDSDNYTELILDTTQDEKSQKRIYSLDSRHLNFKRNLTFKVKSTPELNNLPDTSDDLLSLLDNRQNSPAPNMTTGNPTLVVGRVSPSLGQDGIAFGFPLNFN